MTERTRSADLRITVGLGADAKAAVVALLDRLKEGGNPVSRMRRRYRESSNASRRP